MNDDVKYLSGKISRKEKNVSDNPKAPAGFIYIRGDSKKLTVWSASIFEDIIDGSEVEVTFTESENLWGGKTYINYNVQGVQDKSMDINAKKVVFSSEEVEKLVEENQDISRFKVGNASLGYCVLNHRLIVGDVKDVIVPKDVFYYLIEKGIANAKGN